MITQTDNASAFLDKLASFAESSAAPEFPDWLNTYRQAHLNRIPELGIPTVKDEEWKYTNLAPVVKPEYSIPGKIIKTDLNSPSTLCTKEDINIVLINGQFSPELSSIEALPDGLTIQPLGQNLEKHRSAMESFLVKHPAKQTSVFIALNTALMTNGVFIDVREKALIESIIHITHITEARNGALLISPRAFVHVGESAEATIIESYMTATNDATYLANAVTDITLEENSTLHYCNVQKEGANSYHIGNIRVTQARSSHYDGLTLTTGAALTRNDLDIRLNGEGCQSTLNGLYITGGSQHVDNHTSVDHRYPNCTSNQLYKGILTDASRAVFNGKIFVKPIAQQTNSYQLNKNLLLGKDARIDTKPQLEIFADDVKCTHGATIGQLNEDELFYLQTRCIPRKDAIVMLARGFSDDLLNQIHNPTIMKRLHALLEPAFLELS